METETDETMNNNPKRVQRRKVKGWRMPENTVSVCRPGKWGNPFKIEDFRYANRDIDPYCSTATEIFRRSDAQCRTEAIWAFESWLAEHPEKRAQIIIDLRGKNLACFCPLDQPCHADILLKIANPEL